MALLTGYGVRMGVVGRADLFAMGGIAALYPWPATLLALIGVELWRRWWRARYGGPAPAIPGMFLGVLAYLAFSLAGVHVNLGANYLMQVASARVPCTFLGAILDFRLCILRIRAFLWGGAPADRGRRNIRQFLT